MNRSPASAERGRARWDRVALARSHAVLVARSVPAAAAAEAAAGRAPRGWRQQPPAAQRAQRAQRAHEEGRRRGTGARRHWRLEAR